MSLQDKVSLSGPELVKFLRESVRPQGKKATWMQHLNDRQLVEVFHRLKAGQAAYHIATIVQKDWGLQRDSQTKSVSRAVLKFKMDVVGEIQRTSTGSKEEISLSKSLEKKAKDVSEKIDTLGRLAWLVGIQTERVNMLFSKEKNALPFRHTDSVIRLLAEMIGQLHQMYVNLGILDEVPKEFNLDVKHKFDGILQHTVGGAAPRVMEALENFMEEAEKRALSLKLDEETGAYVLEDKKKNGSSGDPSSE